MRQIYELFKICDHIYLIMFHVKTALWLYVYVKMSAVSYDFHNRPVKVGTPMHFLH